MHWGNIRGHIRCLGVIGDIVDTLEGTEVY